MVDFLFGKVMKFTLHISIDNPTKGIKERIMENVAMYLKRNGYRFDVGFDPREIDIDSIGRA